MLRILTLNTGLTEIRPLGIPLYADVPHVGARAARLAPALRVLDADILILQELIPARAKARLAAELGDRYPHEAGIAEDSRFYGAGLLTLSRHPIEAASCMAFARQTFEEGLFGPRGMVLCTVRSPSLGPCRIVNLHATAGGAWLRGRRAADCRRAQIAEAVAAASRAPHGIVVLAGDFNSQSAAQGDGEHLPIGAGFTDAAAAAGEPDGDEPRDTWDPANPLNRGKAGGTARRVDHVFVRHGADRPVAVTGAHIVLREPVVPLPDGEMLPVSDHYGLLVELAAA